MRDHAHFSKAAAPLNKPLPLWILYPLCFVAVVLSHATLMHLPYFWDEAGYYIPAALDFLHTGTLIPHTTLTNAHPPLPSIILAGWWRVAGFTVYGTRVLVCLFSAAALLAVFRFARGLIGPRAACFVVALTAIYPIWFVQSTLAHADIFAAAFTLWALSFYFAPEFISPEFNYPEIPRYTTTAILFSLAALSKETAIVTPASLALWELILALTNRESPEYPEHLRWTAALTAPILPLAAWYEYHRHKTGFAFGNPEFLRYNATANLTPLRMLLSLWHRVVHLTLHMNLFVPVFCTIAVVMMPRLKRNPDPATHRPVLPAIAVILMGNAIAFSVLGGALLTRYLLPMYPLVLLVCVAFWRQRYRWWWALALLTAAGFLAGLWINPPYTFAPEDNLAYRDMIVLQQQAIAVLEHRFPVATVLTAWPATEELTYPELGYTRKAFKTDAIENFSADEIQKAADDPGGYDTALVFSTKLIPPPGRLNLSRLNEAADTRFFDFHRDLQPTDIAHLLHGEVVWQQTRNGQWAAILRFPRIVDAGLQRP